MDPRRPRACWNSGHVDVIVGAGENGICSYTFTRDQYVQYASDQMDEDEKAYGVHIYATAHSGDQLFAWEHTKILCTPTITLRSGIVCEANRGKWKKSPWVVDLTEHLEECGTRGKINDGHCDPNLNNKANCYDGGDCCRQSCKIRNGGHTTFDFDTNKITYLCEDVDNSNCVDPSFRRRQHSITSMATLHRTRAPTKMQARFLLAMSK